MNKEALLSLAETFADHEGITHWAVSMRVFGKGNFFNNLKEGRDCYQASLERAHRWFGENWPEDLAWPEDIMRPDRHVDREQVA